MLIKLPNKVVSTKDLQELLDDLEVGRDDSGLLQLFSDCNPRINQKYSSKSMMIEYIKKLLSRPKTMTLSFAQKPDEKFIEELVIWIRKNIDEHILCDIKIEPMLVGGLVLRSPQKVYDFSWDTKLSENRSALEELVNYVG